MAEFFNSGGEQFDKLYENLCNFCKKAANIMNEFEEESVKKRGDKKHFGNRVTMAMVEMCIDLKKIMDSAKTTCGQAGLLISNLFSISKELKKLIEIKKIDNKKIKKKIYSIKEAINKNNLLTAITGRDNEESKEKQLIENYKMIMNDYLEKIEDEII